jgi:hypothetical protein
MKMTKRSLIRWAGVPILLTMAGWMGAGIVAGLLRFSSLWPEGRPWIWVGAVVFPSACAYWVWRKMKVPQGRTPIPEPFVLRDHLALYLKLAPFYILGLVGAETMAGRKMDQSPWLRALSALMFLAMWTAFSAYYVRKESTKAIERYRLAHVDDPVALKQLDEELARREAERMIRLRKPVNFEI